MKERFESSGPVDLHVIDRLVDGELTAGEERNLLSALEFQPDGWRRCALAFVEARVWKNELATVTRGDSGQVNGKPLMLPSPAADEAAATASAPAADAPWSRTIAIAASIALAFVLGLAMRGHPVTGDGATDSQIVAVKDHHNSGTGALAVEQPTITMSLVDNQGDVERQLEIPVVETDTFDPRWLQRPPSAIPQEVAAALRRNGHVVEEQRLYVPIRLDDGRQAIIPLDQAEVRFVGTSY